jgi:hypothetical protein
VFCPKSTATEFAMDVKVLELALIVGVAFGLGFWQLYDVDKALKDDRDELERNPRPDRTSADSNSDPDSDSDIQN